MQSPTRHQTAVDEEKYRRGMKLQHRAGKRRAPGKRLVDVPHECPSGHDARAGQAGEWDGRAFKVFRFTSLIFR